MSLAAADSPALINWTWTFASSSDAALALEWLSHQAFPLEVHRSLSYHHQTILLVRK